MRHQLRDRGDVAARDRALVERHRAGLVLRDAVAVFEHPRGVGERHHVAGLARLPVEAERLGLRALHALAVLVERGEVVHRRDAAGLGRPVVGRERLLVAVGPVVGAAELVGEAAQLRIGGRRPAAGLDGGGRLDPPELHPRHAVRPVGVVGAGGELVAALHPRIAARIRAAEIALREAAIGADLAAGIEIGLVLPLRPELRPVLLVDRRRVALAAGEQPVHRLRAVGASLAAGADIGLERLAGAEGLRPAPRRLVADRRDAAGHRRNGERGLHHDRRVVDLRHLLAARGAPRRLLDLAAQIALQLRPLDQPVAVAGSVLRIGEARDAHQEAAGEEAELVSLVPVRGRRARGGDEARDPGLRLRPRRGEAGRRDGEQALALAPRLAGEAGIDHHHELALRPDLALHEVEVAVEGLQGIAALALVRVAVLRQQEGLLRRQIRHAVAGIVDEDVRAALAGVAPEPARLRVALGAEDLVELVEGRVLQDEDVAVAVAEALDQVGADRLRVVVGVIDRDRLLVAAVADHHRDRVGVVGERRRLGRGSGRRGEGEAGCQEESGCSKGSARGDDRGPSRHAVRPPLGSRTEAVILGAGRVRARTPPRGSRSKAGKQCRSTRAHRCRAACPAGGRARLSPRRRA
ncbi:hypothetical protein CHKEEEPN_0137 [Methylorubrum podarium]|nr:hypothetical protein CHKEEEPN_0137 [Methylorubrum podarium]